MSISDKELEKGEDSFSWGKYLKDVFLCSLVAFGGPEAHLGVFLDRLVQKKKYLTEKALLEWMALCSFLPGPTSTQVITAIGLERGGRSLALLTLIVWALPVILFMSAVSTLPAMLGQDGLPQWLGFLAPVAAAFVGWAAWTLGRKVTIDLLTFGLWSHGFAVVMLADSPWAIPLAFVAGGGLAVFLDRETKPTEQSFSIRLAIPWAVLGLFIGFLFLGVIGSVYFGDSLFHTFERFYRYGYLVFGGGQVVVPLMQGELVQSANLMSQDEFLAGFGLVQALPGPMFSFAAYAGGLCEQGGGWFRQFCGAMIGGWAIFLPGTLLLFFVYPFWGKLKSYPWATKAQRGVNAVAGGLVAGVLVQILMNMSWVPEVVLAFVLSFGLLLTRKVPAPLIVILVGTFYAIFSYLTF
ncbi:chromate efflux transporter [Opitutales bacterium]|nr:chromate efflux transporter [Opitutales bacterium]